MSTTFLIKDINNKGCLTVKQILEIEHNITQYDISEDDEGYEEFLEAKIDEAGFMLFGQDGVSARGFEFYFDKEENSYCIRAFSPCSVGDFDVIFSFIKHLGNYLENSTITTDNGEKFSINNIDEYPYIEHIMAGLEQTDEIFNQSDMDFIEIYGVYRPVSLNKKIFMEIMNSDNPVEKFSEFITDIQYIDAFSANQRFFQSNDGLILCVYSLTETVRTILPFKPVVNYQYTNIVKNEDVHWEISLVVINGDPEDISSYETLGRMDYAEFIKKLPQDKYSFIDAAYILVEGLSQQEMKKILE